MSAKLPCGTDSEFTSHVNVKKLNYVNRKLTVCTKTLHFKNVLWHIVTKKSFYN